MLQRVGVSDPNVLAALEEERSEAGSRDSSPSNPGTGSSSTGSTANNNNGGPKDDVKLRESRNASKQIVRLRFLLAAILLVAALSSAIGIYQVTHSAEQKQFETIYNGNALKILGAFEESLRHTIGAIDNYALVTSTEAEKEDWPFVVSPNFDVRGASSRALAGAGLLSVLPLVSEKNRVDWEEFSTNHSGWVDKGLHLEGSHNDDEGHDDDDVRRRRRKLQIDEHEEETTLADFSQGIANTIYRIEDHNHDSIVDDSEGPYWPVWQTTPIRPNMVNYNLITHGSFGKGMAEALEKEQIVLGLVADVSDIHDPFNFLYHIPHVHQEKINDEEEHYHEETEDEDEDESHALGSHSRSQGDFGDPLSMTFFPIFDQIDEPRKLVGLIAAAIYWRDYFVQILPSTKEPQPIFVVLQNGCGQAFSYRVLGETVEVLGEGEFHETRFDHMEHDFHLADIADEKDPTSLTFSGVGFDNEYCPFVVRVFPTSEMEDYYVTNKPAYYGLVIVVVFLFATGVFIFYDILVGVRQRKLYKRAEETSAVVNSLFPANVRDRLFPTENEPSQYAFKKEKNCLEKESAQKRRRSLPIADLFPKATVMFADIAGFTAWSSSREPTQVFTLLEAIYGKFDHLARRRKVFKVETIGDCYVAVTGVPEAQEDHAVRMAQFACSCLSKMNQLMKELEVTLGPDTEDLTMRIGLHSGPVTAGVLRGERSRFQLFGDTVNTASRIESTGVPNRIQCSEATAELLLAAGKGQWLVKREESVHAKGKGAVQTYWINQGAESSTDNSTEFESKRAVGAKGEPLGDLKDVKTTEIEKSLSNEKLDRLVGWNVDVLSRSLKKVVAARDKEHPDQFVPIRETKNPILDVKETISIPLPSDAKTSEPDSIQFHPQALVELRDYVTAIASMYHSNHFHNFEHASHVTLSAQKMLSRIVVSKEKASYQKELLSRIVVSTEKASHVENGASDSQSCAYGITDDPLTQFAVLFSTMIHDVDHSGVSNGQLIKEGAEIAKLYCDKSVAEQNSIDVAWDLLMEPCYAELRKCIFTNQEEHDRFRSLIINAVIATDIFDDDLKDFRAKRWEKAFQDEGSSRNFSKCDIKATIVIEQLMRASDVCHTMQHWHVYQKWNEHLFHEMYSAYQAGRAPSDPSEGWYEGELWFYDNYSIPMAIKLRESGVFGVSSDEYLNYAKENRREWESKGKMLVEEWVAKYKS